MKIEKLISLANNQPGVQLKFEISKIGHVYSACCYNKKSTTSSISDSVYSGLDKNIEVALRKAIMEFFERGFQKNHDTFFEQASNDPNFNSDGFAAYPVNISKTNANSSARKNAMNEAVERYAWSRWWDNKAYKSNVKKIDNIDSFDSLSTSLLNYISSKINISHLYLVEPTIENSDFQLRIFFLKIQNLGYISGGACEKMSLTSKSTFRAISELYRHTLAYLKLNKNDPVNYYERKILRFASDPSLLEKRIQSVSETKNIKLPPLSIDMKVPSPNENLLSIHRCYFKNQPIFLDEDQNRFCI